MAIPTAPELKQRNLRPKSKIVVFEPANLVNEVAATHTTNLTGATNNDLVFTARAAGTDGNSITIAYVNAGASKALQVSVSAKAISVQLATDGSSAITSTAAQVKAKIEANPEANDLVVITNAAGNDGSGLVAAFSAVNLSGGVDGNSFTAEAEDINFQLETTDVEAMNASGRVYDRRQSEAKHKCTAKLKQLPAALISLMGKLTPGTLRIIIQDDYDAAGKARLYLDDTRVDMKAPNLQLAREFGTVDVEFMARDTDFALLSNQTP